MKKFLSYHRVCRTLIIIGFVLILLPVDASGRFCGMPALLVFFNAAVLLPFLYPLSHHPVKVSLICITAYIAAILSARILGFQLIWFFIINMLMTMMEFALMTHFRMENPKKLFLAAAVWSSTSEYARSLHLAFSLSCGILAALSLHDARFELISILSCSFVSVIGFAGIYSGRLFISGKKTEQWIKKNAMSASMSTITLCKDTRMMTLYEKVLSYMAETTSYLEESFDLDYLTRALGTNRVYLSRTINLCSGQNFRKFLNSYRIKYAIDLMQKDKMMKLKEVSAMSGFHTQVSFDMAFKSFTGLTPSEYMENFRDTLL